MLLSFNMRRAACVCKDCAEAPRPSTKRVQVLRSRHGIFNGSTGALACLCQHRPSARQGALLTARTHLAFPLWEGAVSLQGVAVSKTHGRCPPGPAACEVVLVYFTASHVLFFFSVRPLLFFGSGKGESELSSMRRKPKDLKACACEGVRDNSFFTGTGTVQAANASAFFLTRAVRGVC